MSLQDSLFVEEVEIDVTLFTEDIKRKRVLVFPPTNNYRRFLIHQFVQENFGELLSTFSIGQGSARRTVVCYKSDTIRDLKLNGASSAVSSRITSSACNMGVENPPSPPSSPENSRQRQVKSMPAVEIYRPPAARRSKDVSKVVTETSTSLVPPKMKHRRPDRAVYVPKARRNTDTEVNLSSHDERSAVKTKNNRYSKTVLVNNEKSYNLCEMSTNKCWDNTNAQDDSIDMRQYDDISSKSNDSIAVKNNDTATDEISEMCSTIFNNISENHEDVKESVLVNNSDCVNNRHCEEFNDPTVALEMCNNTAKETPNVLNVKDTDDVITNQQQNITRNFVSDVLIISNSDKKNKSEESEVVDESAIVPLRSSEKKLKKIARTKSKPALPPVSPVKFNRDECDWDSLFDDNGECLDPTLIEELTAAVGEVTIEQPKNVYKTINRTVEVSSDEFAHVVEIYNFPSDFKTSDLAAVFSPFKNGGFELKWVDDTHCLGVFSSPLVAAEVLASDHQFVKTRPLSEATALSRTKAKRSAEFLQPYRSRPETCAALARRLVTGALGVKLATAQQEREREKILIREAKERRRLANKQREDAWEGVIAQK